MVRLAFAVAINVDPEILIIDEALSVGDELFQRKCFSRIEAIRAKGATILFVSHSGAQIVELCDRAILLDGGEMLAAGAPKQIVGRYQKLLYAPADKQELIREKARSMEDLSGHSGTVVPEHEELAGAGSNKESFDPALVPSSTIDYESHGARIESPVLLTLSGERVNNLCRGKVYRYCYTVRFTRPANHVRFGMLVKTISGVELGGGASAGSPRDGLPFAETDTAYNVEFRFRCALNPGIYFLNAGVMGSVTESEVFLHRLVDVAMFRVLPEPWGYATGVVDFDCCPDVEQLSGK
jgi:lipopolysaccharide transport system ATP-binding protein